MNKLDVIVKNINYSDLNKLTMSKLISLGISRQYLLDGCVIQNYVGDCIFCLICNEKKQKEEISKFLERIHDSLTGYDASEKDDILFFEYAVVRKTQTKHLQNDELFIKLYNVVSIDVVIENLRRVLYKAVSYYNTYGDVKFHSLVRFGSNKFKPEEALVYKSYGKDYKFFGYKLAGLDKTNVVTETYINYIDRWCVYYYAKKNYKLLRLSRLLRETPQFDMNTFRGVFINVVKNAIKGNIFDIKDILSKPRIDIDINGDKNWFSLIRCEIYLLPDYANKLMVNKYYKTLLNYILNGLRNYKSFTKYNVSVNFLKVGSVFITKDDRLVVTFQLKKEMVDDICI